jgi:hypothetical protein
VHGGVRDQPRGSRDSALRSSRPPKPIPAWASSPAVSTADSSSSVPLGGSSDRVVSAANPWSGARAELVDAGPPRAPDPPRASRLRCRRPAGSDPGGRACSAARPLPVEPRAADWVALGLRLRAEPGAVPVAPEPARGPRFARPVPAGVRAFSPPASALRLPAAEPARDLVVDLAGVRPRGAGPEAGVPPRGLGEDRRSPLEPLLSFDGACGALASSGPVSPRAAARRTLTRCGRVLGRLPRTSRDRRDRPLPVFDSLTATSSRTRGHGACLASRVLHRSSCAAAQAELVIADFRHSARAVRKQGEGVR